MASEGHDTASKRGPKTKPPPPKGERRSRRTHKNSRDGCPNCRANRIKCTEELPSCLNCMKKKYRCGYADFPPERLEHIRRKNELKLKAALAAAEQMLPQQAPVVPQLLPQPQPPYVNVTSVTNGVNGVNNGMTNVHMDNVNPINALNDIGVVGNGMNGIAMNNGINGIDSCPMNDVPKLHGRRSTIRIRDKKAEGGLDTTKLINIRNTAYSTLFREVHHEIAPLQNVLPPDFKPWDEGTAFEVHDGHQFPSDAVFNPHQFPFKEAPQAFMPVTVGTPLPHAFTMNTTFKLQPLPPRLRNTILERSVKKFQEGNFDLKAVRNDEFHIMDQPVWSEDDANRFWILVINQSLMLNLYFMYFSDKAINILMRASDAVVSGDIDYTSLPSTVHSALSPLTYSPRDNSFAFFYNAKDLDILRRKSFISYGRIIRALRESLNSYNPEYPAKMSLFSAWLCYLNVATDMSTFCLMLTGTTNLVNNILHEFNSTVELPSAVRQLILMMNNFVLASAYPDYNFEVVLDLTDSFIQYKTYVDLLIVRYENGANFDADLLKVLRDPLFRHDYHELDKFLTKLREYYYPIISSTNAYYKQKCGTYEDDPSIHYVSPTLIFEMTYEWFKVYPGDKMSMGSKINPLKKTLYFFFHALGKCLAHVFTPMKSLLFVDACNVTFTKVGMQFMKVDALDREEYRPIVPVVMSLFKTIRFFENRLLLFGYYMEFYSSLDLDFIVRVPELPPTDWKYRDVVHLATAKKMVKVKQMTSFSRNLISVKNIPLFDEIKADPTGLKLIQKEMDRQYFAVQHEPYRFDYVSGMSNHDFNPQDVIEYFVQLRREKMQTRVPPLIETLRARADVLIYSRNEVAYAIHATAGTNGVAQD